MSDTFIGLLLLALLSLMIFSFSAIVVKGSYIM